MVVSERRDQRWSATSFPSLQFISHLFPPFLYHLVSLSILISLFFSMLGVHIFHFLLSSIFCNTHAVILCLIIFPQTRRIIFVVHSDRYNCCIHHICCSIPESALHFRNLPFTSGICYSLPINFAPLLPQNFPSPILLLVLVLQITLKSFNHTNSYSHSHEIMVTILC